MDKAQEIQNCPFCGGEARFDKTVYKEVGVIRCQSCRATNGIITQEHTAIKAWNSRATPGMSPLDKLEEEKSVRIKYQDIVYKICALFDETVFIGDRPSTSRCTTDTVVEKVKQFKKSKFATSPIPVTSVEDIKNLIINHKQQDLGFKHSEQYLFKALYSVVGATPAEAMISQLAQAIHTLLTEPKAEKEGQG